MPAEKLNILLVEDNEANILIATIYIEVLGFSYEIAKTGIEAVKKAITGNYSVIIMDIEMPEMNGLEATKIIRELELQNKKARVPIIGLTAHAFIDDRQRCIDAGMDDYIAKPIREKELRDKLKLYTEDK